jgi:hypothetical protein
MRKKDGIVRIRKIVFHPIPSPLQELDSIVADAVEQPLLGYVTPPAEEKGQATRRGGTTTEAGVSSIEPEET